jgi:uncharacterized ParB-like nuclease family protein
MNTLILSPNTAASTLKSDGGSGDINNAPMCWHYSEHSHLAFQPWGSPSIIHPIMTNTCTATGDCGDYDSSSGSSDEADVMLRQDGARWLHEWAPWVGCHSIEATTAASRSSVSSGTCSSTDEEMTDVAASSVQYVAGPNHNYNDLREYYQCNGYNDARNNGVYAEYIPHQKYAHQQYYNHYGGSSIDSGNSHDGEIRARNHNHSHNNRHRQPYNENNGHLNKQARAGGSGSGRKKWQRNSQRKTKGKQQQQRVKKQ